VPSRGRPRWPGPPPSSRPPQAGQEGDRPAHAVALLQVLVGDEPAELRQGQEVAVQREVAVERVGEAAGAREALGAHRRVVDPADGSSEVFATPTHTTPYVYFLQTPGPPEVCAPKTPLTYRNISVYRIGPGGRFEIPRWRGTGGIPYTLSTEAGVLVSSRGDIY
jgi:hypothetical protein